MSRIAALVGCALCLWLAVAAVGCKKSDPAGTVDTKLFDAAQPEVKDAWNTALGAAQTNDWATAYLTLVRLRQQSGLSEAQLRTIGAEITKVHAQLNEAAQKGDPNAQKALLDIRAASRTRER